MGIEEQTEFNNRLIGKIKSYWTSRGYPEPLMRNEVTTASRRDGTKVTALTIRSNLIGGQPIAA